jgi:hypothetical protein
MATASPTSAARETGANAMSKQAEVASPLAVAPHPSTLPLRAGVIGGTEADAHTRCRGSPETASRLD